MCSCAVGTAARVPHSQEGLASVDCRRDHVRASSDKGKHNGTRYARSRDTGSAGRYSRQQHGEGDRNGSEGCVRESLPFTVSPKHGYPADYFYLNIV